MRSSGSTVGLLCGVSSPNSPAAPYSREHCPARGAVANVGFCLLIYGVDHNRSARIPSPGRKRSGDADMNQSIFDEPLPEFAVRSRVTAFVDNAFCPPNSGIPLPVINPATELPV